MPKFEQNPLKAVGEIAIFAQMVAKSDRIVMEDICIQNFLILKNNVQDYFSRNIYKISTTL